MRGGPKLAGGQGGSLPRPHGWPHLPYLVLRVLWRGSRPDGDQPVLLPTVAVLDGPGEVAPVLQPLLPVLWVVHEGAGVQRTPVLEGLSPIQELQRFCCWPRLLCLVLWGRSHPHGDHPGLVLTAAVLDGPGEAAPVPVHLLRGGEVGRSVGRGMWRGGLVLRGGSHPDGDQPGLFLTAAVTDGSGEEAPVLFLMFLFNSPLC